MTPTPTSYTPPGTLRTLVRAVATWQQERWLIASLSRRMARIEATLRRYPNPGPARERLERRIEQLRRDVRQAQARFAERPLASSAR